MDSNSLVGTQVGNYLITELLGQGGMGTVYRAEHPDIGRRVAIKVLAPQYSSNQRIAQRFLSEAKAVVRINHPNIIDIFDFGKMTDGRLYYVMELLRGRELINVINDKRSLTPAETLPYLEQICAAIQAAHEQDVVHRDLKPENIFVLERQPLALKVLDFGIAKLLESDEQNTSVTHTGVVLGTPLYLSPEQAAGQSELIGPRSDIYSLGAIIFLMLSGRTPFIDRTVGLLLSKHINEKAPTLNSLVSAIPASISDLVARCLAKDPNERPSSALEVAESFKKALSQEVILAQPSLPTVTSTTSHDTREESNQQWTAPEKLSADQMLNSSVVSTAADVEPEAAVSAANKNSTLEHLLLRMKRREDFPAISQYISDINRMAILSHTTSAAQMANTILKDFSLTSKLLKLVNSAFYGRYAGSITTISRAVVILGFEQVRMAATSLTLFDHLQNQSQADDLKDASISAFMSGMMAKEIAPRVGVADVEEAFLCSMFHNLGRQLVIFYFAEEYKKIVEMVARKKCSEELAIREVLGVSYEELGTHVAKLWKFPDKVINCMHKTPTGEVAKAKNAEELLRNLSNFSNELCQTINSVEPAKKDVALAELSQRYKKNFSLDEKQLSSMMQSVFTKGERYSAILNINTKRSGFFKKLQVWQGARPSSEDKPADQAINNGFAKNEPVDKASTPIAKPTPQLMRDASEPENRQAVIIQGIQEITNTLLSEASLDDVLTMILETMYRGFGFGHVLVAILSTDRKTANARFGLGENIEQIIKAFHFAITPAGKDVFNQALSNNKDMVITDAGLPEFRPMVPDWYRQAIGGRSFLVYPFSVFMKPIGLFYADHRDAQTLIIPEHVKFMQTLRNQAVLAIKQKYSK